MAIIKLPPGSVEEFLVKDLKEIQVRDDRVPRWSRDMHTLRSLFSMIDDYIAEVQANKDKQTFDKAYDTIAYLRAMIEANERQYRDLLRFYDKHPDIEPKDDE